MKTVKAVSISLLPDGDLARLLANGYAGLVELGAEDDMTNVQQRVLNLRPAITEAIRRLTERTRD